MKFIIKHEVKGRLRIHVIRNRMTCAEADILCWTLEKQKDITSVKVYERTADAVIYYTGDREELIGRLRKFRFEKEDVPENVISSSGRALNSVYREKPDRKSTPSLRRKTDSAKSNKKNMAYF